MGIENTVKSTHYQSQLSFHDVFRDSNNKHDTDDAGQNDKDTALVNRFTFHSLFRFEGQSPDDDARRATSESHSASITSDVQHRVASTTARDGRDNEIPGHEILGRNQSGSLTERIVASISSHEGSFTSINHNDAGYGISVGIRQWNQKTGELPNLIRAWHNKNPARFTQIFGDYTPNLLDEKWVRSYDMANDSRFMNSMKNALADKDLQRVQMEDAHRFVNHTTELAKKYGFQSEFGIALVCEMVNQMGQTGTERTLAKCGIKKNEGTIVDEHQAALNISRVRPDGKRFHNLLAQRFSPALPGMTLA